jgi:poly-gamma-glutamate capsule biosynthesis protein CapA/YwtB (metallophosphatase superfamily)
MNEENAARAERRAALAQKIADDASLPEDEKMGDKELQIAQLEAQTETNEHLQDVAHELAVQNEADYIRDRKADMPDNPPLLSNNWGYDPYADFTITN